MTMDYKLAHSLKDAGFPKNDWHKCAHCGEGFGGAKDEITCVPTLEELVEACMKKDEPSAFLLYSRGDIQKWYASSSLGKTNKDDCEGATPTEAVTKLWIALHTK